MDDPVLEAQTDFQRLLPRVVKQAESLLNEPLHGFQPFTAILKQDWLRQVLRSSTVWADDVDQAAVEQDVRTLAARRRGRLAGCIVTLDKLGEPDAPGVLALDFHHSNGEQLHCLVSYELRDNTAVLVYEAELMFPEVPGRWYFH